MEVNETKTETSQRSLTGVLAPVRERGPGMSVEAISWALKLAPVPADRNGQPSSACEFVLVGLANHARPGRSGAFPSVRTLIRYLGLPERTVRTCLDRLKQGSLIRPCDPAVVAAKTQAPSSAPGAEPKACVRVGVR